MAPRLSAEDEAIIRQLRAQPKISGAEAKKRNENSYKIRRTEKSKWKERVEVGELGNARIAAEKARTNGAANGEHQKASPVNGSTLRTLSHVTLNPNNELKEIGTGISSDGNVRIVPVKTTSSPLADINVMAIREPQTGPQPYAEISVPGETKVSDEVQNMTDVTSSDRAGQRSGRKTLFRTYGKQLSHFTPRNNIYKVSQDAKPNFTIDPTAQTVATQYPPETDIPASKIINSEVTSLNISISQPNKVNGDGLPLKDYIKKAYSPTQSQIVVDVGLKASPSGTNFECRLADEEAQYGNSTDQDEQLLDNLDHEILNLGRNNDNIPSTFENELLTRLQPLPAEEDAYSESDNRDEHPQPKKRRTARHISSAEVKKAALRQPKSKQASKAAKIPRPFQKKASNSSAKKGRPRRLPVGELVIASERVEEFDAEAVALPPFELAEDQIITISDEDKSGGGPICKQVVKSYTQLRRRRKLVETIELRHFRMPKRQLPRPILQSETPCSDGFEGKEADPIGRTLPPMKHSIRRHDPCQRVPVYIPPLLIAAEKQVGHSDMPTQQLQRGVERSKAKLSAQRMPAAAQEQLHQEDHDISLDNNVLEKVQPPPCVSQHLPTPDTRRSLPLVLAQLSLPKNLKAKKPPRSTLGDSEVERQLSQVTMERQVRSYSSDEDEDEDEDESQVGSEDSDVGKSDKSDAESETSEERSYKASDEEGVESEDGLVNEEMLEIELQNTATNRLTSNTSTIVEHGDKVDRDQRRSDGEGRYGTETSQNSNRSPSRCSKYSVEAKSLIQQFYNHTLEDEKNVPGLQKSNRQLSPGEESQSQSQYYRATQYQNPESSWRPQVPDTSGVAMETQEEIYDSPSPIPVRRQKSNNLYSFSPRTRSIMRKRAISRELSTVQQRAESPLLGRPPSQISTSRASKFLTRSPSPEIPETQYSEPSHNFIVPDNEIYFSQASDHLQRPMKQKPFTRTMSVPATEHQMQLGAVDEETFASHISSSGSFRHTVNTGEDGRSRQPRLLSQRPSGRSNTLKMLTRRMSQEMGTIPGRPRIMSALQPRFKPPFTALVERI